MHARVLSLGGNPMHRRYRSCVTLMLAIAWLIQPTMLSLAVAQTPPLRGTELGGMGVQKASLHGHVYHLTTVADFAGLYAAAELGFTLAGGEGGMAMRNEHGVTIYLVSVEEGIKTTIGGAGVEIQLQP